MIIRHQHRLKKLTTAALALFFAPLPALAAPPIQLLEPIGTTTAITLGNNPLDVLNQYLQPLMPFVIGTAAGLAVLMIVLGGMQIMLSDGNYGQSPGRERILAALGGQLLLVFSAAVLYMLNANYFIISP